MIYLCRYVTLQPFPFVNHSLLQGIIVDTHFVTRDRMGRLVAFAGRLFHDRGPIAAVGVDEATAIVIDSTGKGTMLRQVRVVAPRRRPPA